MFFQVLGTFPDTIGHTGDRLRKTRDKFPVSFSRIRNWILLHFDMTDHEIFVISTANGSNTLQHHVWGLGSCPPMVVLLHNTQIYDFNCLTLPLHPGDVTS